MAPICCRLCLLTGPDLRSIPDLTVNCNDSNESVTFALSQLIVSYLSIEPVFDGVTETYVCAECCNMIAKWHWFRESCLHNDGKYQKMALDPGDEDDVVEHFSEIDVKQEQEEEITVDEKEYQNNLFSEPLDAPPPKQKKSPNKMVAKKSPAVKAAAGQEAKKRGRPRLLVAKKSPPAKAAAGQEVKKRGRPRLPPLADGEKNSKYKMCTICGKVLTNIHIHMKMHRQDRSFQCPHCPANFYSQYSWKGHVNVHTKEVKFTCPVCDKVFWRRETLKMHMNSHSEERIFKCPYCPKAYKMRSGLAVHRKSHTGAPSIQCDGCDKKFYTKDHMKHHAVTHLEVKPYKCKLCERRFTRKLYLAGHVEKAHPDCKETEKQPTTMAGDSDCE